LNAWFEDTMEGARQIVFIAGEPGLGKTTLVDTWMRTLRQPVAVARGRCLQQFGSGEPYLPVFEALEQLGQTLGHRLVEHLRSRAPTWLLHMPSLISLEDRVKLRDEVFGSTRERMLREVTDALEALSGEAPLVIALEDLHWSDPSTIDLLSSVARRTSAARLMILGTYRPSGAGGNSDRLLAAQNELQLHRQCKVLPLDYLSESAIAEYLAARDAELDGPALAAALHRRTNGNPLYVVSLVDELERSGKIGGDPAAIQDLVPETLQQMFERQALQLSAPEQEMLDVAATAGERFSVAAVAAATGRDPDDIESACEDLVRRQVILKRGDLIRFPDGAESPGYLFVHALCRDALYRRIPSGRRARLHGQLGRAREQLHAADPQRMAGQMAGHFETGGDFARAIRYLRLAADGAAGRWSNQEALQYLERAFVLVERLPEKDRPPFRMDLLEQRARMHMSASEMRAALVDYTALADQAHQLGDVDAETSALLESAVPLLFVDYKRALAVNEQARMAQPRLHDWTIATLCDASHAFFRIYLEGWRKDLADALMVALRKLRQAEDPRVRSRAAWMESCALCFVADYAAACETAEESRRLARKAGVFFEYFVATMYLNWAAVHRGDLGLALRVAKDGAELAAKNGSKVPLGWFTVRQSWVHLEAFDLVHARAAYERLVVDPVMLSLRPHTYPQLMWLGLSRMALEDHDGAWQALEEAHRAFDQGGMAYQMLCPLIHGRAACELARGNVSHARSLVEELFRAAGEHGEVSYIARGHLLLAEMAYREEDFQGAAESVAQAESALAKCEAWNVEWRVHAMAARVFSQTGKTDEAEKSRERCLQAAERVAATLADEPALLESFKAGVERRLGFAKSSKLSG
jgi:tetratricopeptide (TPR) repeat protein